MTTVEAMEFLLDKMSGTKDNQDFFLLRRLRKVEKDKLREVLKQQTKGNFVSSIMCPSKYVKCPCLEL